MQPPHCPRYLPQARVDQVELQRDALQAWVGWLEEQLREAWQAQEAW